LTLQFITMASSVGPSVLGVLRARRLGVGARADVGRQGHDRTFNDGAGRHLDRRAFFAGVAGVAVATGASEATAATDESAAELPQILGEIRGHVSPRAVEALADDGHDVRIVLSRGASVERGGRAAALADFQVGDWFLAVGRPAADGTFSAARVIPAVLGAKQPPRS
jgi:hypothetical protein